MDPFREAPAEDFVALRRDLHRHPELAFDEHRTSARVAAGLRARGDEVATGIGGTGVVGRLVRGSSTRSIGLRADVDTLPIEEATWAAYWVAPVNELLSPLP